MEDSKNRENYDAPTLLLKDSSNDELFCYLEQIVKVEGTEYALLTPVDTPVTLFKINEKDEPILIEKIEKNEQILQNADAVLQEHDLNLIRSAVTLTVAGELEESDYDELEEDEINNDDSETYELLVNFNVLDDEYGLYVPLDPFFIVAKILENGAILVEDEEFDRDIENISKLDLPITLIFNKRQLSNEIFKKAINISLELGIQNFQFGDGFGQYLGLNEIKEIMDLLGKNNSIKIVGGIKTIANVKDTLEAGADCIGTSYYHDIFQELKNQ